MPSWTKASDASQLDEAIFFLAAGGALATAVFTAGGAANLNDLGRTGAELSLAGTAVSWWIRKWPSSRSVPFGALVGLVAGAFWLLRLMLGMDEVADNPGLVLALEMTVPLVILSFVLVRAEIASFALVPGLSVMGLAAGQGNESFARVGFTFFLPLALLAVGYAMLATGTITGVPHRMPEGSARLRGALHWRIRHWPTLAGVIIVIMAVAELIYLPMQRWAEAHRWEVIAAIATPGLPRAFGRETTPERNSFAIGQGPSQLSEIPYLTFRGEYAAYWREQVYDRYQGTAWGHSQGQSWKGEYAAFPPTGMIEIGTEGGRRPTKQVVQVQASLPLVFFAPGRATRILARTPMPIPANGHLVVDAYDVVRVPNGTFNLGDSYEVSSVPFDPRVGVETTEEPDARYLALPMETARVAELARQVAGKEPTGAKKLAALTAYLQTNCRYSLDAPAIPAGHDAVDYFVREQKVGYCDLFASALAVMGRAVGVPTRLVTGYAFPAPTQDGKDGSYVLTQADGHAWVEAYLSEAGGWVTMDATPAVARSSVRTTWWQGVSRRLRLLWRTRPLAAAGLGLGLALVLVAAGYGVRLLRRRLRARTRLAPGLDGRAEVVRQYLRLCHYLRRRGYPRHASQTPLEYLAYLEEQLNHGAPTGAALPAVRALTEHFLLARYSPEPVGEEMARAVQEGVVEVRRVMKRGQGSGARVEEAKRR